MILLKLILAILLLVVSSVSYTTESKVIPILGHNGQSVEFSGISYATKEGIHARLQNGSEMQVSWSLIDKSIFREQGGALQEPYIFLQASDIVYLAWGFYISPHFDESLLNFKSKVIQCATDQFAIIASKDYSKYGVAFVCVTKGISISKAVLIDPFAAPPSNDSGFESRVLQKELDTLGITGKPAVEIDLGDFELHVFFREHLRSIIGYDPNQSPLFDLTTLTDGSVNPFNRHLQLAAGVAASGRQKSLPDQVFKALRWLQPGKLARDDRLARRAHRIGGESVPTGSGEVEENQVRTIVAQA